MPNDILNEIDEMSFTVPELMHDEEIRLEGEEKKKRRPIVIITSNSEHDLPEAFLRRCIYYHLNLPPYSSKNPKEVTVQRIVRERLWKSYRLEENFHGEFLAHALSLFDYLRSESASLRKRPQIAEFLAWFFYLVKNPVKNKPRLADHPHFRDSLSTTLLKYKDDQDRTDKLIEGWLAETNQKPRQPV